MTHAGLVPGNRWDLLPEVPSLPVAVVVTHYEQPAQLARTLAALAVQTFAPYEVVVADDGSPTPPQVPDGVRVVTQQDRGFRAAAARNLGARATSAPVLAFLDADTVPEPGYLAALTARVAASPDVLAVGRRRHADLSGDGAELPEPAWLIDGYAQTRDLLDADGRSFRFVISAVMACRRSLLSDLAGFDERYVGYGGEDWDLAYRAWNAGALLVHERHAVAWHDGPSWAPRTQADRDAKVFETARLAQLVPEPSLRRGAHNPALPDVLVDAPGPLLLDGDLAVRTSHDRAWTQDQLARARVRVRLDVPVTLRTRALDLVVARLVEQDLGELVLLSGGREVGRAWTGRALGRARRWPGADVIGDCFGRACHDLEQGGA